MRNKSKNKLIRVRVCPDVMATDFKGEWHTGWRKPFSQTIAFYYKKAWYSLHEHNIVKMNSKEKALQGVN